MEFKVGLTDDAIADLRAIAEHVSHNSGKVAEYIGNELIATAESLSFLPYRGARVKERDDMRKLFRWNYAIYYRVREGDRLVEILRIWDMRQDPQKLRLP